MDFLPIVPFKELSKAGILVAVIENGFNLSLPVSRF